MKPPTEPHPIRCQCPACTGLPAQPPPPPHAPKRGTIWRHWKGKTYQVINLARHTDTSEWMVIYLDASDDVWCRPLTQWHEQMPDGSTRFRALP